MAPKLVATVKENASLSVIDPTTGAILSAVIVGIPGKEVPHEFALTPDNSKALVTLYGNADYGRNNPGHRVAVVDLREMSCTHHVDLGLYRAPHSIVRDAAGLFWVTVEENNCLVAIDLQANDVVRTVWTEVPTHFLAVTADGMTLYCAHKEYPFVSLVDIEQAAVVDRISLPVGSQALRLSQDERLLYVGDFHRPLLHVIDVENRKLVETISLTAVPGWPYPTPDGKYVVLTTYNEAEDQGYVEILNANDLDIARIVPVSGEPFHAHVAEDPGEIFIAVSTGEIQRIELETGSIIGAAISTGGVMPEMIKLVSL